MDNVLNESLKYIINPNEYYLINQYKPTILSILDLILNIPKKYNHVVKVTSINEIEQYTELDCKLVVKCILQTKKIFRKSVISIKGITHFQYPVECLFFTKFSINIPLNQEIYISGKFKIKNNSIVFIQPRITKEVIELSPIAPIYSNKDTLNKAITKIIHKVIRYIIDSNIDLKEWIPSDVLNTYRLSSFLNSIFILHCYYNIHSIETIHRAEHRLSIDEAIMYGNILNGSNINNNITPQLDVNESINNANFPYKLRKNQINVLENIYGRLSSNNRMFHMLFGDTGSGKTIIAIITTIMILGPCQPCTYPKIVFLSPSLLLSHQIYSKLQEYIPQYTIHYVSGKVKKRDLNCHILVGTQALLSMDSLGEVDLFIIDEYHKFGTRQRNTLLTKSENAHVLMMSATPSPRALLLIQCGIITHSILNNEIANITAIPYPIEHIDILINKVIQWTKEGQRIYWVCPSLKSSMGDTVFSCFYIFNRLKPHFENNIGMLHGNMDDDEMIKTMDDFRESKIQILVCTTTIEVGVDISNVNVMIIQNPERFGIAQLHQIRGRVSRNGKKGFCILVYGSSLEKIQEFSKLTSGFDISNYDLKRRGGGEIMGNKQAGKFSWMFIDHNKLPHWFDKVVSSIKIDNHTLQLLHYIFRLKNNSKYIFFS